MSQTDELKNRVEAKKLSLQAKIKELQADTQATSREQAQKLQAKLDSLNESIKGGWDEVTDAVAGKLNEWLKDD
jgi:DNA-binding transcriptional MerR regulator